MTGPLPLVPTDQRLSERLSIKVVILGKVGIGKTSRLAELANALPPIVFFPLDAGDGSPDAEVCS